MSDSGEDTDGATAEDETPHGAPEPETLDDRTDDDDPEVPLDTGDEEGHRRRDEEQDRYQDKYAEAREETNPDQHRDEEEHG